MEIDKIKDEYKGEKLSDKGQNKIQDLLVHLNKFVANFKEWLSELDYAGDDDRHIQPNSHRFAFFDFSKDISDMVEKPQEKAAESKSSINKFVGDAINAIGGKSSNVNITPLMTSNLKDRKHLDETGKK